MHIIRDISSASSFWGAAWVFGCMPDVHMVCDAPIGCFAMVSLAVADYTDAIPYLASLTPTVIREEDVINGTAQALKRTVERLHETGMLQHKQLIVLSSAESEMIGADHTNLLTTLDPDARFFWSHSLEQDEWTGRDQALLFAWREYGAPHTAINANNDDIAASYSKRVNIIGPTLACFNAPSDVHEVKRLVAAAGGTINLVYPYEATIADTPRLADAAVTIVMYREYGEPLAQAVGKPYLFAPFGIEGTRAFLYELAELLGTPADQIDAFIANEKRTTLALLWDVWRGPQSDWFSTVDCCVVAGRSYVDGLHTFLQNELGMRVVWHAGTPRTNDEPDNSAIRTRLHEKAPTFVFGSINERIYLAEAQAQSRFIAASFPGPIVRRTVGTPFMGFSGVAHITQEIINHLYEIVLHFLPVETIQREAFAHGGNSGNGTNNNQHDNNTQSATSQPDMLWTDDATTRLNDAIAQVPFMARFSASSTMRQAAERIAHTRGLPEVTLDVVEENLAHHQS